MKSEQDIRERLEQVKHTEEIRDNSRAHYQVAKGRRRALEWVLDDD